MAGSVEISSAPAGPPELLNLLVRLALCPEESEPLGRELGYRELAAHADERGDRAGCDLALREAVATLRRAQAGQRLEDSTLGATAFELGRFAAELGRSVLAREAYLISEAAFQGSDDGRRTRVELGLVQQQIADTWKADGNGREVLRYHQLAVKSLADDFDLERRLMAWRALADAGEVLGDRTVRDSALADALRLFDRAVVQTDPERKLAFRLAHELGEDAARFGCHRLAREALTKAGEQIAPLGRQPGVALVLCDIGHTYLAEGDADEALMHFRAALDALDLDPPRELGFEVLATLADAELRWGEEERCESALQAALRLLSAAAAAGDDDGAWVALAASSLADMAAQLGRRQAAIEARHLAARLSGELTLLPPSEDA